jgi:hypothetical protein
MALPKESKLHFVCRWKHQKKAPKIKLREHDEETSKSGAELLGRLAKAAGPAFDRIFGSDVKEKKKEKKESKEDTGNKPKQKKTSTQ